MMKIDKLFKKLPKATVDGVTDESLYDGEVGGWTYAAKEFGVELDELLECSSEDDGNPWNDWSDQNVRIENILFNETYTMCRVLSLNGMMIVEYLNKGCVVYYTTQEEINNAN